MIGLIILGMLIGTISTAIYDYAKFKQKEEEMVRLHQLYTNQLEEYRLKNDRTYAVYLDTSSIKVKYPPKDAVKTMRKKYYARKKKQ